MRTLKEVFNELGKNSEEVYFKIGKIKTVENGMSDIEMLDGTADVLEAPYQFPNNSVKITPKIGSKCLVGFLDKNNGYLVAVEEIEKVEILLEGTKVLLDKQGIVAERNGQNLGNLIDQLVMAIQNLVIDTPAGPGAVNAASKVVLNNLKTQFKQVLK